MSDWTITMPKFRGHLDGLVDGRLCGWAQDIEHPERPMTIECLVNGRIISSHTANRFRPDLMEQSIGSGCHSFEIPFALADLDADIRARLKEPLEISVRPRGSQDPLTNSPIRVGQAFQMLKLDPINLESFLRGHLWARVDHLLIDPTDTCNADCVYCPNLRSRSKLDLEPFKRLLSQGLKSVGTFQFGCGQEPMAHSKLSSFFEYLASSKLSPQRITIITNGTLLAKHDLASLVKHGLTDFQISLDTVDPSINDSTRKGIPLKNILSGLEDLRAQFPQLPIIFSTVVHALNSDHLEKLLDYGQSLGVAQYYLRELFDHLPAHTPARRPDYLSYIRQLSLAPGQFEQIKSRIKAHPQFDKIHFIASEALEDALHTMTESEHRIKN